MCVCQLLGTRRTRVTQQCCDWNRRRSSAQLDGELSRVTVFSVPDLADIGPVWHSCKRGRAEHDVLCKHYNRSSAAKAGASIQQVC